jgi:hypothetical protein
MADEALTATFAVVRVLDALGIPYLVGGSLASSLHGIPRSTQDSDVVVDLSQDQVSPLLAALGADFYADEELARRAVEHKAAFNVIHLETMFKVDLFVIGDDEAAREEMRRRERHQVGESTEQSLYFATAEDTVLQKLAWYRLGHGVSDRQWRDLLGVLRVQGARLDRAYLDHAARALGVAELLGEALAEAGLDPAR